MTRPTRHLGLVPSQRVERYQAHDPEKQVGRLATRSAVEAWEGIALGLLVVACYEGAYRLQGAPRWFAISFAAVVAVVGLAATVKATK